MRFLIVKISIIIFQLYQWMLTQCQFLSTFSVLNRFAQKDSGVVEYGKKNSEQQSRWKWKQDVELGTRFLAVQ